MIPVNEDEVKRRTEIYLCELCAFAALRQKPFPPRRKVAKAQRKTLALLPEAVLVDNRCLLLNNPQSMNAPKFLLRGFRRPSEVASLALGKLERQVLDETWRPQTLQKVVPTLA